jgi:hypothetical protein
MNPYIALYEGVTVDRKFQTFTALMLIPILLIGTSIQLACNAQTWQTLIASDLPIVEQQAQNIIAIADPVDLVLAQQVSKGVSAGVTLVEDAYTAYKANPNATTEQALAAALDKAATDLPNVLTNITFSNPIVGLAITAAVGVIVTTLDIVAANMPASTQTPAIRARRAARMKVSLSRDESKKALQPESLKATWDAKVCDPYPTLPHCPRM